MKQVYTNLSLQTGAVNHGIISVQVAAKEWLVNNPVIDFNTGKVITAVVLSAGRSWLTFEFTQPSYQYDEKPKSNKSGSFYEVSLSGTLNNHDADVQQVIESLRYHQLVAIVTDKNKRIKLAGTKAAGFVLSPVNKLLSGSQIIQLDMMLECEDAPPYYEV